MELSSETMGTISNTSLLPILLKVYFDIFYTFSFQVQENNNQENKNIQHIKILMNKYHKNERDTSPRKGRMKMATSTMERSEQGLLTWESPT